MKELCLEPTSYPAKLQDCPVGLFRLIENGLIYARFNDDGYCDLQSGVIFKLTKVTRNIQVQPMKIVTKEARGQCGKS